LIFVTVGTTLPFDSLVQAIDDMVSSGKIAEPVRCQIGPGRYEPRHCEWFRFKPSLEADMEAASLIVGHGGTGTVTGLLASGKPFVAVANPLGVDNHQRDFLARLCQTSPFVWTDRPEDLSKLLPQARTFRTERPAHQRLASDLLPFLQDAIARRRKSRG
jgi:beta-1,4-N-acetylglucosaminyltransferase